jgi:uncharacterized protein DUF6879
LTAGFAAVVDQLRSSKRSAAHLEMRDCYMRSDPMFTTWQKEGFRDGPARPGPSWRPWFDLIAAARVRGAEVRRARIVSEPVSEYVRFEYDTTVMNVAAGEQVRWLSRRRVSDLALPGNDFWVFDDTLVLWNYFTGEGEPAPDTTEATGEPLLVKACAAAFEAVWERAIPHQEYQSA